MLPCKRVGTCRNIIKLPYTQIVYSIQFSEFIYKHYVRAVINGCQFCLTQTAYMYRGTARCASICKHACFASINRSWPGAQLVRQKLEASGQHFWRLKETLPSVPFQLRALSDDPSHRFSPCRRGFHPWKMFESCVCAISLKMTILS